MTNNDVLALAIAALFAAKLLDFTVQITKAVLSHRLNAKKLREGEK